VTTQDLFAAALKLPEDERRKLAELLDASLPVDEERMDDDALVALCSERDAEVERGDVQCISADEAFARLRAR
jgi:hypothetical protein